MSNTAFLTQNNLSSYLISPADSPLGLLEELFIDDPWRLLLRAILLNRTSRVQVDPVMATFLDQWPTARAVVDTSGTSVTAMEEVLQPLGLGHRRAIGIGKFSQDYLKLLGRKARKGSGSYDDVAKHLSRNDILNLFQCGDYASDAYRIFIRRRGGEIGSGQHNARNLICDHALKDYGAFQQGKASAQRARLLVPS